MLGSWPGAELRPEAPTLAFKHPSQPHNAAPVLDDRGPQEASGPALSGLTQASGTLNARLP